MKRDLKRDGYGSIPIDTFLVGYSHPFTSYFGVHQGYQGFDPSPDLNMGMVEAPS